MTEQQARALARQQAEDQARRLKQQRAYGVTEVSIDLAIQAMELAAMLAAQYEKVASEKAQIYAAMADATDRLDRAERAFERAVRYV